MKNLLRLIFVALACQANVAHAFWGDGWLKFYDCENEYQARSCQRCKLDKELLIKFVVNQQKSTVFVQLKENGVISPPDDLGENGTCAVIDDKNWSCSQQGIAGGYITKEGMATGTYSSSHSAFNVHGGLLKEWHSCAK